MLGILQGTKYVIFKNIYFLNNGQISLCTHIADKIKLLPNMVLLTNFQTIIFL